MEPERRIEKLLHAFAKKRREQAGDPMELHPVARQQLQNEIARRAAGTSRARGFSSYFIGLRPKLIFAFCFTGLIIIGLALLPPLTHPKPSTFASANLSRDEMVPTEKTTPALTPPPVSTVAPLADGEKDQRVLQDKQPAVSGSLAMNPVRPEPTSANRQAIVPPAEPPKQMEVFENGIAQTKAPTGAAVASTAPSNKETFAFKDDKVATVDSFGGGTALNKDAINQPLPSAPSAAGTIRVTTNATIFAANEETRKKLNLQSVSPATASGAFFDSSKSEMAAVIPPVSQVFNRLDFPTTRLRAAGTFGAPAPVLVSFRMEQTGNAMRVVDADGSVYIGTVQRVQPAGAVQAVAPKNAPSVAPAARAAAPSPAAQNYFFRVAGTNRNLKQNVVFSGNFIPLTNTSVLKGKGGGFGGAIAAPRAGGLPADLLLSNSRISGKAVVGDQKEIEVNATPAPAP